MSKNLTPPADLDAEAAVLSSCLLSVEAIDEVHRIMKPEHPYSDANRHIYQAITELHAQNQTVDIVSVANWLRGKELLEKAGGTSYLGQIVDATPSVAHVADHAKIVRDKWRLRTAINLCRAAAGEAYGDVQDVDKWVGDLEAKLSELSKSQTVDTIRTFADLAKQERDDVARRKRDGSAFVGLPTGLRDLDAMLNGLKFRCKYEIAARPGIGKSGLALSISMNVAEIGWGVVWISVEMPNQQLIQRAVAQDAGIDTADIESGNMNATDWAKFTSSLARVSRLPIVSDEAGEQTLTSIRASVRRGIAKLRQEHPSVKLGMVVIDYLQLLEGPSDKNRNRENEVSELSKGTRKMAKEFDCVVLELSQLNRSVETRADKRPVLADLRESGSIEQDAYAVLMLYRDDYYRNPNEVMDNRAEILVRKVRQGGRTGRAITMFHGPSAGFFNLEGTGGDMPNDDRFDD